MASLRSLLYFLANCSPEALVKDADTIKRDAAELLEWSQGVQFIGNDEADLLLAVVRLKELFHRHSP